MDFWFPNVVNPTNNQIKCQTISLFFLERWVEGVTENVFDNMKSATSWNERLFC